MHKGTQHRAKKKELICICVSLVKKEKKRRGFCITVQEIRIASYLFAKERRKPRIITMRYLFKNVRKHLINVDYHLMLVLMMNPKDF